MRVDFRCSGTGTRLRPPGRALVTLVTGCLAAACGPLPRSWPTAPVMAPTRLTKSDLPPVLPPGARPGPTTVFPAQPSYLLAGRITGISVQGVEATTPAKTRRYRATLDPGQVFTFAYMLPDNYVLEIQTNSPRLLLQRLVGVWLERAVFLEIKIDPSLEAATVDDLPFAILPLAESGSGSATPRPDPT